MSNLKNTRGSGGRGGKPPHYNSYGQFFCVAKTSAFFNLFLWPQQGLGGKNMKQGAFMKLLLLRRQLLPLPTLTYLQTVSSTTALTPELMRAIT